MRRIGTDGAATMTGRRSGVVTRLKELATSAVGVHCAAHRLNLAASQAANTLLDWPQSSLWTRALSRRLKPPLLLETKAAFDAAFFVRNESGI